MVRKRRKMGPNVPKLSLPAITRFWMQVDKGPHPKGCWLWTGRLERKTGYGSFMGYGMKGSPHRWIYMYMWNRKLPREIEIMHDCDVRHCVRLSHLRPGSRFENMQDCVRKGRNTYGLSSWSVKITPKIVREIRRRVANGETQRDVADDVGLGYSHLNQIVKRRCWAHVD